MADDEIARRFDISAGGDEFLELLVQLRCCTFAHQQAVFSG